jgi:hypothetical protein
LTLFRTSLYQQSEIELERKEARQADLAGKSARGRKSRVPNRQHLGTAGKQLAERRNTGAGLGVSTTGDGLGTPWCGDDTHCSEPSNQSREFQRRLFVDVL